MVALQPKAITETDVYLFAAISQDFAPMHLDESWAARTIAGGRIAHGVFTLALMSQLRGELRSGYSRVRFIKPVHFGDVVSVTCAEGKRNSVNGQRSIEARNQRDEVVAAATAITNSGSAQPCPTPLADYPDAVWISRTIAACDVAIFDFVTTGDISVLSALANGEQRQTAGDVAPPELCVGLMSGASTVWEERHGSGPSLSYGYDDVVFSAPLRVGESIRIGYAKEGEVPEQHKLIARTEAIGEDGQLIASALHILWQNA